LSVRLEILEDPAAGCAQLLESTAASGGDIVLTGGSTPKAAYEQITSSWDRVAVWFSDERCVPPDDERSNFGMANEGLLARVHPAAVHRMRGELAPDEAAEAYERELHDAGPPQFDLILLGLGPDGHLASMFPDQKSLSERSRLVLGVPDAGLEPFVPRVTLTFPALALARRIVFLVTGASKADAVAAAFGPDAKPDPHIPASLLPPWADDITVLLDSAAAARLETPAGGAS
jgi:6-phosphogluconolactonase